MYNACRESQIKSERHKYKDKQFNLIFWKIKILELLQTGKTHSLRNVALKPQWDSGYKSKHCSFSVSVPQQNLKL